MTFYNNVFFFFSYKKHFEIYGLSTNKKLKCVVQLINHGVYKVVIYNYVFVGFNSVPNFIVILFNLMYPIFHAGFICKDCVWERESVCEESRLLKTKGVSVSSSWVSFPRSDACALHMTGMRRVKTGWRQLVFVSISRVRPSHETPAEHFVLPNFHFWYTLSLPILYIPPITHICWGVLLRENPIHQS